MTRIKKQQYVHEYGDLSIDSQLIKDTKEEIIEMNCGCICCNVRGDLISILSTMLQRQLKREIQFERVIIETTGPANPAAVVQTLLMDDVMSRWFELDSVCTVLDSKHIIQHLCYAIPWEISIGNAWHLFCNLFSSSVHIQEVRNRKVFD